jgi:putative nucleotidyltransferase with HDIG domain
MSLNSRYVIGPWYIAAVIATGVAVIAHSLYSACVTPPPAEWMILAALTLFTGSFTVKVPTQAARLSVSETFVFTSTLLFGPASGTVTAVLEALVMSFWLKKTSLPRVLFNVSAPAIAIWTAAQTFFLISGLEPGGIQRPALGRAIGPLFVFALLYFIINTAFVAGAVRTERNEAVTRIWVQNFAGLGINYFVGGSIAVLLVAYTPRIDVTAVGIIVPILLISYTTFRTSMGRLEDATKHVAQLNDLYMSAIEALAMAVDAKDQITHGHIRRVQVYATELAKRVGVQDDQQLRAIETAALLHDMGKLAVPEHILNKPGKLTPGEFDKMKRHADIGADLLSAIPFPYPVVPIVRHHHENWDGTGYPHKVAGTDIPLGARILSVVDCFDALTSDRPYRPRLSKEEAFEILRERRGTMYDPLVVDAFISAFDLIAPAAIRAGQEAKSLVPDSFLRTSHEHVRALDQIQVDSSEASALHEAHRLCIKAATPPEALESMSSVIRELTPAHVIALYEYVPRSDVLRCSHATNDPDAILTGFEIAQGERTTGWAAANGQTITNSAAALDFGQLAQRFTPPLRSTLSAPITRNENVLGVLSLYSQHDSPFTERHTYVAEQIAAFLSECVDRPQKAQSPIVRFPNPVPKAATGRT